MQGYPRKDHQRDALMSMSAQDDQRHDHNHMTAHLSLGF